MKSKPRYVIHTNVKLFSRRYMSLILDYSTPYGCVYVYSNGNLYFDTNKREMFSKLMDI